MRAFIQRTSHAALCGLVLSLFVLNPALASAQDRERGNVVFDVAKAVVFDPTTYAPATLSYT